jgi:hypothetical protein
MSVQQAQKKSADAPKKDAATTEPEKTGPENDGAKPSNTPSLLDAQRKDVAPTEKKEGPEETKEEPKPKSSGLTNYEATLGKWLGPKLYKAVKKEITQAKLAKIADSGMKGALKALGKGIGDLADGDLKPGDVDKLVKALQAAYGKEAGKFVKAHPGVGNALNGFVDANPILIVTIGLLAAAGAIAADMDIPEFSTSIGLGAGFSAEVGAKLGSLQHLALDKIEAGLSYESKQLKAKWVGTYEDEDGFSTKMNLKYQASKETTIGAFGQWSEKDGAAAGLNLDYKPNDRLSVGAFGKYSEKNGASAGVGVKWRF